jgi:hypothetical protein
LGILPVKMFMFSGFSALGTLLWCGMAWRGMWLA